MRAAILEERFGRPTEHVDETGRDGEAFGFDFRFAARVAQSAHGRDRVAVHRHLAHDGGISAAVVNRGVADEQIELRGF